ncbi:MbcA/ParS/Xre antitoxin family protein [Paucibacter sp. R3-3]|uniref:MbcA/ParS/Xre antitoxin family protein n=1 Tax=Roseateles agri TaxID=3098619 RepID=A0ABU5DSF9_9BURK|nr:MbcA/ParS/Xre antitoxin family protein [Paucibacter sp. R3-3]MDY0748728.1 MbcA/ParS/Xre antitoxin family protein [Paucibacter sp. R3-3]
MTTDVLLDCEMTSLLQPQLLSIGLVTLDGRECYAELDLASDFGKARLAETAWDVRDGVIKDKWGLFPEAICASEAAMGMRVGEWLLNVAASDDSGRIELMFDYPTDYELLVGALEECGLWPRVQAVTGIRNIANETGLGVTVWTREAAFRALRQRSMPLGRHHALADALALRSAWKAWTLYADRHWQFVRMQSIVGVERNDWVFEWIALPAPALGGRIPLDVLDQQDGLELVLDALHRVEGG